jgi:hypothetical protein
LDETGAGDAVHARAQQWRGGAESCAKGNGAEFAAAIRKPRVQLSNKEGAQRTAGRRSEGDQDGESAYGAVCEAMGILRNAGESARFRGSWRMG